jgi:hypothetical protein
LSATRSRPAHRVLKLVADLPLKPQVQVLLAPARPVLLVALRPRGRPHARHLLVAAPLVMSAACPARMSPVVVASALLLASVKPAVASLRAVLAALRVPHAA